MPNANLENSKRIAKNTLLLYVRMLLTMFVSLYTSRIVLNALGVEDFGIYNVVGGVVAMFSVLSGSLSSAISRFITFELGKGNKKRLNEIFSSAVSIQFALAITITIIAEAVGVWFLNTQMNIPQGRMFAANWVFQFSILTFGINLISIPYNACIIAHEKMSVFAYISILEVLGKLLIAFLILISPIDKLIIYAILMCIISLIIRFVYAHYCQKHFSECTFHFIYDKQLLKEMFGFAGWNFIGSASGVFRDQGGNIILNIFFNTTVNASRGIANQVYNAIFGFVANFMTALNPQITKSYAVGDYEYMMKLINKGCRFSCYLLFLLSLPILINTEYILTIWLKTVPEHSVLFVQLILIFSLSEAISKPLITAQLATGNIRNYQLVVGGLQMLNLPIAYVTLAMGGRPESIFIIAIIISQGCLYSRLYMLRNMIGLSACNFIKNVYSNIILVCIISSIIPIWTNNIIKDDLINFIITSLMSFLSCGFSIIFIGCDKGERAFLKQKTIDLFYKVFK